MNRAAPFIALVCSLSHPAFAADVQEKTSRIKVGLALEGGGALALAHVGLLEWFDQHHIPVDYIAGTSMGGLVAGFYASGMTAAEMRHKVDGLDWDQLVGGQNDSKTLAFRRREDERELGNRIVAGLRHGLLLPSGLNSGQDLDLLLSEVALPYGEVKSFNDLPTPFRCVAMDLTTATAKVFDSGLLGRALRATMSIPGFYEPVLQKGPDGKTHEYVDGGLLNNLPVDLVKAMGADIVIAVYLADDPYDPNKPHNAIAVLGRSLGAVMAANERHNIEMADVLVSIDLTGLSVGDFSKAQEIMDRGLQGTEKRKTVLAKFALNDSDWGAYTRERASRRKTTLPPPQFVTIEGLDAKEQSLARDLHRYFDGQIGKPLDIARLNDEVAKVMAPDVFAHVAYAEIERDGKPGLAIYVERSNSRPPTFQPQIAVEGSDYLNPRFAIGGRFTRSDFGGFRSELQVDVFVGSMYGVIGEYFHPLTPLGNWFVAPQARAQNIPLDFYRRSRILAFDRETRVGGGLDVGYSIGNTAEIRLGYEADRLSTTSRVGDPVVFPILSGAYRASHISYKLDRVDDEIVPHRGILASTDFRWVDANPGSSQSLPVLETASTFFQPLGSRNTAFVSAEGGTTFGVRNAGLPFFRLGGPQRLSAYGMNELIGDQYFLGRVGFLKQVNASIPFADGRIYLFVDYEVAKMYGALMTTALPMDVNAGVLVRTPLGPLFLGGSTGDAGHRKWYFDFGRFF